MKPPVEVRRIYDDRRGRKDEYRVLVDRLWPRGVAKDSVRIDRWAKEVAPSGDLRRWYGHVPERFEEFERRYRAELGTDPAAAAVEEMLSDARDHSVLVLLTATKDVDRSGAEVLAGHLESVSSRSKQRKR